MERVNFKRACTNRAFLCVYEQNLRIKSVDSQIRSKSRLVRESWRDYFGAGVKAALGFEGIGVGWFSRVAPGVGACGTGSASTGVGDVPVAGAVICASSNK